MMEPQEDPTTINPAIEEYKNQYLYLDDQFLSRSIDFCIESTSLEKLAIQIVVFSLDTSCKYVEYTKTAKIETPLPFLKFAGIIENSLFCFPGFNYECLPENNEIHFQNQILEKLLSTFGFQPSASLDYDSIYRGYLLHQTSDSSGNSIVYVAIDYDELVKQMTSTLSPIWAIVDELLFEKKVLEMQVDPRITDMMDRHPYMWNITYNGDYIEYFPFSLYLVITKDEQTYESNSLPREKSREKSMTIGTKIDSYSLADEYGERYCFTDSPLSIMENIVRYAVFTPKPIYILDNAEGGQPTIVGLQTTPTVKPVAIEITASKEEENYDNIPDSDKEVLEETMSENIAHSVIYFTEKTGNLAGKHVWGIKTHHLFSMV